MDGEKPGWREAGDRQVQRLIDSGTKPGDARKAVDLSLRRLDRGEGSGVQVKKGGGR